ncbi:MAG: hypothetical protein WA705_16940 [Candidatus Ozemobacteraceae bacterium]
MRKTPALVALLLGLWLAGGEPAFAASFMMVACKTEVTPEEARLRIRLSRPMGARNVKRNLRPIEPCLHYIKQENCWHVDLPDVIIGATLEPVAGCGPFRLARFSVFPGKPPVTRLNVYVRPGTLLKIMREDDGFLLTMRESRGKPQGESQGESRGHSVAGDTPERLPNGLLAPSAGDGEIVLDVKRASSRPLLVELARRTGSTLEFRDGPPRFVTVKARASDALTALRCVASALGMVLSEESGGLFISRQNHRLNVGNHRG